MGRWKTCMPPAQVRHGIDIHPQPCSLTIVMLSCVSHEKAFSHTCCAVRQVEGDSVTSLGFPSTRGLSPSGSLSGAQLLLLLGKKSTASSKDNLKFAILRCNFKFCTYSGWEKKKLYIF